MQPKLWAQKAPEYIMEAKEMGVRIHSPDVQGSGVGFTTENNEVFFGLNAIKGIGAKAAVSILRARKHGRFQNIMDFLVRVDKRKVNAGTFKSLVKSGAFDRMGYRRQDLLDNAQALYDYGTLLSEYAQRLIDSGVRTEENKQKEARKQEIETRVKEAKAILKEAKKNGLPAPEWATRWKERDARLRHARHVYGTIDECNLATGENLTIEDLLSPEDITEYKESVWLRKKPELKLKSKPEEPSLRRYKQVVISVSELMQQADMIGCYLGQHPARVVFSNTQPIASVLEGDYSEVAGVVLTVKEIMTRRGDQMAFIQFGDGTSLCEGVIFPQVYLRLKLNGVFPAENNLVCIRGRVEQTNPLTKILVDEISIHQGE